MSRVVIQGDASGTGDFTIAAPNSNTDRTLTLPDEAGTVLTTSGVPSSAMPAGSVLQVVEASTSTQTDISTTSYSDVLTATITPSSTLSKILVTGVASGYSNQVGASTSNWMALFREATEIHAQKQLEYDTTASTEHYISYALQKLDSPSTTSATTYKIRAKRDTATYRMRLNYGSETAGITLVLMEIAG